MSLDLAIPHPLLIGRSGGIAEQHPRNRRVIVAGAALLAAGIGAFMSSPKLGLLALALPVAPFFILKP